MKLFYERSFAVTLSTLLIMDLLYISVAYSCLYLIFIVLNCILFLIVGNITLEDIHFYYHLVDNLRLFLLKDLLPGCLNRVFIIFFSDFIILQSLDFLNEDFLGFCEFRLPMKLNIHKFLE